MPESSTPRSSLADWRWLALCAGGYAILAIVYALRLPVVMDEFQGASAVDRLLNGVPYRDFVPYKNVLGYYLQLPVLAVVRDPWWGLITLRVCLVLVNGLFLLVLAMQLRPLVTPAAAMISTSLLACMTTFVERGHELRVDQLAGWLGAFGLLAVVRERPGRAGFLLGLAFLFSQKAAFFMAAGAAAALVLALDRDRGGLAFMARYSAVAALTVLAYFAVWSLLAGPGRVLGGMFPHALDVAMRDPYMRRWWMWLQSGLQNPVFWGMCVVGIVSGFGRRCATRGAAAFATTLLGLSLAHRQPWSYFIASLAPALAVAVAIGIDAMLGAARGRRLAMGVLSAAYVILGLFLPLSFAPTLLTRSNAHQRDVIRSANGLLGTRGSYLAGVHLIRFHPHQPPSLGWLDAGRLGRLHAGGEAIVESYLDSLRSSPPDLVIDNYRVRQLPCSIRLELDRRYVAVGEGLYALRSTAEPKAAGEPTRRLFPLVNDYGVRVPQEGLRLPPGGLASGCSGQRVN